MSRTVKTAILTAVLVVVFIALVVLDHGNIR